MKVTQRKIASLKSYERNARTHSPEQVEEIAGSIKQFGFVNPVLVRPDGTIIAGHGRVEAAKFLGMDKVPCVELDHLTDVQARALALADNRIPQNAAWDFELLASELKALDELQFDISGLGFSDDEINAAWERSGLAEMVLPEEPEGDDQEEQEAAEESEAPEPPVTADVPAPIIPEAPKASGDDHSLFELVMRHENKLRLVKVLDGIRRDRGLPLVEEALMVLLDTFEGRS